MKIAYTFGIIDFLNYGHIHMLKKAKEENDINIFGLVGQNSAREWLGNIISSFDERKSVVEGIRYIDEVLFQETITPEENLFRIKERYPNSEIKIYCDKKFINFISPEILNKINGKIEITEYYDRLSPENILKKFLEKDTNNIISTKANTLLALKEKIKYSKIEDIYIVIGKDYLENEDKIVEEISENYKGKKIVVRSSCSNEDSYTNSNAGHYESILNINSASKQDVTNAIKKVFESYKKEISDISNEQVLVQNQTEDVRVSGVVFTRDINYNRPFYLINYDDNGSTDSVTSGVSGKSLYISYDFEDEKLPSIWKKLLKSIREIQNLVEGIVLDIEFAITKNEEIIIFQVRPLAANYKYKKSSLTDDKFLQLRESNIQKYKKMNNILGENNILLSDMAFWNPSEIIGENPKPLDYSLYRRIITQDAWNIGLIPLGYKEVIKDLMYKIGNKPYISVDDSFYSLIPSELEPRLAKKLLNFYKEKLKNNLKLHDKIEFEIVYSCYDFTTEKELRSLVNYGFSEREVNDFKDALYNLTKNAFEKYEDILIEDKKSLKKLNSMKEQIEKEQIRYNILDICKAISNLIEALKSYGTPQFSRQARYAFMAKSICKSLIDNEYSSQQEIEDFMLSINTVASDFKKDFDLYLAGQLNRDVFNKKYGHLRSGTYDIRTDKYEKLDFKIVNKERIKSEALKEREYTFKEYLSELKFALSNDKFIEILKKCIENREYFKYEFTKSLSLILELIMELGNKLRIDRKELSYIEIYDLENIQSYSAEEVEEHLRLMIKARKSLYSECSKLLLPEVVVKEEDFSLIEISESKPNFISNKSIEEEIILLEENMEANITGKIVVITKADPGFDWIFTKDIGGLITKYGGVASHMAIRCAEFGIPAAIGCGEKIYSYVEKCKKIKLDCKNQRITNEI